MDETQEIFEAFLASEPDPHGAVDELCERHPERANRLRDLWDGYRQVARLLDDIGAGAREDVGTEPGARYEVRGEIARGGMGRVLEVWDKELRRPLAMKVLRDEPGTDDAARAHWARQRSRLLNEAQILGQLEHPGIVPVHEVGRDARGRPYFTMLRVRGRALGEIFDDVRAGRGGWTLTRAVGVLLRACEAVAYAHQKGVVHRDLKPSNVMVGSFGEVFVMDWGLAKARGRAAPDIRLRTAEFTVRAPAAEASEAWPSASVRTDRRDATDADEVSPLLTMDGDVLGTPSYMAPEQAAGRVDEVDELSDVYSLGAMLYHLLAGRAPYADRGSSSTPREVLRAVMHGEPDALERLATAVPRELSAICAVAMARERDRRYRAVAELAADLRAHLEGHVVRAHRTGPVVELRKWAGRHRTAVVLLGLLLVLLSGSSVGFAWLYGHAETARANAQRRLELMRQNPSGEHVDFSSIPSLRSFVEDFDDAAIDRPLRIHKQPQHIELREGKVIIDMPRGMQGQVGFGLDDSYAVVRGDFNLSIAYECEGFSSPEAGERYFGLSVRRLPSGEQDAFAIRFAKSPSQLAGHPPQAHWVGTRDGSPAASVPCTRSSGTLRIARVGDRFSVYDADGVRPLVEGQGSRTALYFGFYVEAGAGDPGGFRVTFDDLRLETSAGTTATPLGSIVETFDGELPDYLTKGGWAGIVGVSKGRLFLENFADVVGQSRVALRAPEFVLRGDFEVSFDYELVDWVPPSGRDVCFDVDLVDLSTHQLGVRLRCTPGAPPTASAGFGPKGEATPEPLPGRRGRLRLTRAGSRITVEYGGEEWRELAAADGPPADLHMMFNLSNSSTPGGATVALDNLRIEGLVFTP